MPKHDWLTPKAIANRIKSKGLQKLRWYCQMCQKQCRDENGFKCHTMSESHQRQLLLVAESPGKYIHAFSHEFLEDFMYLLSRQYGTRRVNANEVYQQYIKDKNHFHMNATRWVTLTGFVKWLGREGLCEVDPTPKGWFIKYIDRSPEALARQAAAAKKEKMDKDDEERSQKMIEEQIARAMAGKEEEEDRVYTELQRSNEEERVVFSLSKRSSGQQDDEDQDKSEDPDQQLGTSTSSPPSLTSESRLSDVGAVGGLDIGTSTSGGGGEDVRERGTVPGEGERGTGRDGTQYTHSKALPGKVQAIPNALKMAPVKAGTTSKGKEKGGHKEESRKRKISALEEIMMMEEHRKEKMNRRDNWLAEGIVVKVMHKKLGERYYRHKGVVEGVKDLYTAMIKMKDSGDKIKIDQAHLETVIPAIGKPVLVVNGAYRGLRAILESLDTDKYCVSIRIDQGPSRGRLVERVQYEDISKLDMDT